MSGLTIQESGNGTGLGGIVLDARSAFITKHVQEMLEITVCHVLVKGR